MREIAHLRLVELPAALKVSGPAGAKDESVGLASYPPELEESRVLVVEDEGEIRGSPP